MPRSQLARNTTRRTGGSASASAGGAVADGDYGAVIVSGGGAVWTLDPTHVRREVWAAGHDTNDSATVKAIGNFVFNPNEYATITNMQFRAVFNNGNITCNTTVTLRNMTAGINVCSFTLTGAGATGVTQQAQALSFGLPAPNVLAGAATLYEVRISVTAPALVTDVIEHWKSFLAFTS